LEPENESKMNYLVSLPIIERIRKDAEKYKGILNAEVIK
jgi:hypothetical protein